MPDRMDYGKAAQMKHGLDNFEDPLVSKVKGFFGMGSENNKDPVKTALKNRIEKSKPQEEENE